ncbi:S-adenosyl-L-methionine-dependent methyltransferase [Actinoplanes cyaneus]|uniref:S-adenosyl-L-methionine-dependent methyltransferase n=1 Tax=Actinoplanes cyaneus TaxID=52696 RepID=A0A919M877_9ACTN|nr:S-adenosyl-L-methionine-dependent methyltransferase [Actinoplanes cyaneus]
MARTALWTAAARARESRRPDRLFSDPFAAGLAGDEGVACLSYFHTPRAAADGNPVLPIRTRWFDDFLAAAHGTQMVGLGVGLDTRAHRLSWPAGAELYEVDQPHVLAYKEERLRRAGALPRCRVRPVAADLRDDWVAALLAAGFDPARPTVWFAEGVLFYLPEKPAARILTEAARLSAPASRIAFDLVGTGVFRLPYMRTLLDRLAAAGSPWRFGTDDPAAFTAGTGWRVDRIVEPGAPGAAYGRWPALPPAGPANLPRSYLVAASRPGPATAEPR